MIISHRSTDGALSPLLISTIIILCSAFLIALLYFLHSKLLHLFHGGSIPGYSYGGPAASLVNELGSTASSAYDNQRRLDHHHPVLCIGLNPSVIESIAVSSKYSNRRRRSSEETEDCAVCLGEFEEGDEIRALPKCAHSFHLACIDVWLRCHASCPVCRARLTSGCPGQFHRSGEGS